MEIMCGDYVSRLCVEIMCGDYVWLLCVGKCLGVFVFLFVCVYIATSKMISECACALSSTQIRTYIVYVVCVGGRGLSILCVDYVWNMCGACVFIIVCICWLWRFRLWLQVHVDVVCLGCCGRSILCVDYVWHVCLYIFVYVPFVEISVVCSSMCPCWLCLVSWAVIIMCGICVACVLS